MFDYFVKIYFFKNKGRNEFRHKFTFAKEIHYFVA